MRELLFSDQIMVKVISIAGFKQVLYNSVISTSYFHGSNIVVISKRFKELKMTWLLRYISSCFLHAPVNERVIDWKCSMLVKG